MSSKCALQRKFMRESAHFYHDEFTKMGKKSLNKIPAEGAYIMK